MLSGTPRASAMKSRSVIVGLVDYTKCCAGVAAMVGTNIANMKACECAKRRMQQAMAYIGERSRLGVDMCLLQM